MSNALGTPPIDASQVYSDATQSDLVRRKMDLDALRKHLGNENKGEKLREACEGFEAIFLQKMWEQMRKTVPKDGYLQSKDQEMYQSMFDIELCKKMAGAGGVGLADMLYQQLSQQLAASGRTTTPGGRDARLNIPPAEGLLPTVPAAPMQVQLPPVPDEKKLTAENLYSPLQEEESQGEEDTRPVRRSAIEDALHEIKAQLGLAPKQERAEAARVWAEERDLLVGGGSDPTQDMTPQREPLAEGPAAVMPAVSTTLGQGNPLEEMPKAVDPATASWQGPGPVSAKPKPFSPFAARAKAVKKENTPVSPDEAVATTKKARQASEKSDPAEKGKRSIVPDGTVWPLDDAQTKILNSFGWVDDPATGKRHWNPGVQIEALPQSSVRAVLPGTVVYAGDREGQGFSVVLEHKGGYRSYYGNLERNNLKPGDRIRHGSEFAQVSAQPQVTASGENSASLYFEMKRGEMAINPENAILRLSALAR